MTTMTTHPEPRNQDASRAYWHKQAARYDRAIALIHRRFDEVVAEAVRDLQGRSEVLEIAAGTGLFTAAIARDPATGASRRVVATDRAGEMLEILQARLREQGVFNVEVRFADALALDFPDASFDAVLMANLLHILPDPSRALSEARRVLRPSGLLCVPTFVHGQDLTAHVVSRLLKLTGFPKVERWSAQDLVRLLERTGFRVLRTTLVPGLLPVAHVTAERA